MESGDDTEKGDTPTSMHFSKGIKPLHKFILNPHSPRTELQVQTKTFWVKTNDFKTNVFRPSGESARVPEAFLPWHHGYVACHRPCSARPSYDLKLPRPNDPKVHRDLPNPKSSPYFFKEAQWEQNRTAPVPKLLLGWFENLLNEILVGLEQS